MGVADIRLMSNNSCFIWFKSKSVCQNYIKILYVLQIQCSIKYAQVHMYQYYIEPPFNPAAVTISCNIHSNDFLTVQSICMSVSLLGWLYDGTGSYNVSFYVSGTVVAISGSMLYVIPFLQRLLGRTSETDITIDIPTLKSSEEGQNNTSNGSGTMVS